MAQSQVATMDKVTEIQTDYVIKVSKLLSEKFGNSKLPIDQFSKDFKGKSYLYDSLEKYSKEHYEKLNVFSRELFDEREIVKPFTAEWITKNSSKLELLWQLILINMIILHSPAVNTHRRVYRGMWFRDSTLTQQSFVSNLEQSRLLHITSLISTSQETTGAASFYTGYRKRSVGDKSCCWFSWDLPLGFPALSLQNISLVQVKDEDEEGISEAEVLLPFLLYNGSLTFSLDHDPKNNEKVVSKASYSKDKVYPDVTPYTLKEILVNPDHTFNDFLESLITAVDTASPSRNVEHLKEKLDNIPEIENIMSIVSEELFTDLTNKGYAIYKNKIWPSGDETLFNIVVSNYDDKPVETNQQQLKEEDIGHQDEDLEQTKLKDELEVQQEFETKRLKYEKEQIESQRQLEFERVKQWEEQKSEAQRQLEIKIKYEGEQLESQQQSEAARLQDEKEQLEAQQVFETKKLKYEKEQLEVERLQYEEKQQLEAQRQSEAARLQYEKEQQLEAQRQLKAARWQHEKDQQLEAQRQLDVDRLQDEREQQFEAERLEQAAQKRIKLNKAEKIRNQQRGEKNLKNSQLQKTTDEPLLTFHQGSLAPLLYNAIPQYFRWSK